MRPKGRKRKKKHLRAAGKVKIKEHRDVEALKRRIFPSDRVQATAKMYFLSSSLTLFNMRNPANVSVRIYSIRIKSHTSLFFLETGFVVCFHARTVPQSGTGTSLDGPLHAPVEEWSSNIHACGKLNQTKENCALETWVMHPKLGLKWAKVESGVFF